MINLFVPELRGRRPVAGAFSRAFLRVRRNSACASRALERLPRDPCVVVANHASYIDGIVAVAALPPDFAFVIKKEMVRVPLAGLLAAAPGLRIRRALRPPQERRRMRGGCGSSRPTGQSLVFFPEGTFDQRPPGAANSCGGAFATAERSDMPVVAVAIHGTRDVLPPGGIMIRAQAHPLRGSGGAASRRTPGSAAAS